MLHDARVAAHEVLQAAAAVGRTLLCPQPDDSHHSFQWLPALEALAQDLAGGKFRSALRPRDLTLLLLDADDRITAEHRPRSVADAFAFYEDRLGRTLHETAPSTLILQPDDEELVLLGRLYGQAAEVLEQLRTRIPEASPVRLWPRHFDIAFLAGKLGVGFLAGDDTIDEPYWYVYNTPTPPTLAPLHFGQWHQGEWTGAVLTGDPDRGTIEQFLDEAIAALRES